MRLGALFSGGKDSTFAIREAVKAGNQICCLITMRPHSPDSLLLHHPGIHVTRLQARLMGLPWHVRTVPSIGEADESASLDEAVSEAVAAHRIEGLVHGGVRSMFQRRHFDDLCNRHCLNLVSPVWHRRSDYLHDMLSAGFRFVVVAVSADGLDGSWLGRVITESDIERLESLSVSCGLAPDFEGGEAETLVVDCPLFRSGIILCGTPDWDGYRGVLKISGASPLHRQV